MAKLIGNQPNQVPTNGDLGTMAYQDYDVVAPQFLAGGRRNLIINGAMQVAQRGTGATTVSSNGTFVTMDRFKTYASQSSKYSVEQSTTAPEGFSHSLKATSLAATTVGAGDYYTIEYPMEGLSSYQLSWGTANAKTVTLSFKVRSSVTGTMGGVLYAGSGTYCYPFEYTISTADTWQDVSITIDGPTSGTFSTDNTRSFALVFSLGVGSTYLGTAGSWQGTTIRDSSSAIDWIATSGATFYLTGVQLEVGSVATPFEHRSYGEELALCERYYQTGSTGWMIAVGNGEADNGMPLRTTMRAIPTFTMLNISNASLSGSRIGIDRVGWNGTANNGGYGNYYFDYTVDAEL